MRKRNNLIIIVFILSVNTLTAQNTGYMGKRMIVNMGTELSPAWRRPVFDKPIQPNYLNFNYILSPNIEVIATKRGTAGVVYHFLNTKYDTPLAEDVKDEHGFFVSMNDEEKYPEPTDLKAHGFGIFYKQYLRYGKAPIGPYFRVQFDGFFFKSLSSYEDRTLLTVSDKMFAMKIEFGNDFLFFDRLRLSTGLSLGLPFSGYAGLSLNSPWINDLRNIDSTKPIYEYARSRILGAYWLGFTVNIGFLAF